MLLDIIIIAMALVSAAGLSFCVACIIVQAIDYLKDKL